MILAVTMISMAFAKVIETAVNEKSFIEDAHNMKVEGVSKEKGYMHFWNGYDKRSQVVFKKKNKEKNWSFEFTITVPILRYPQTASIYAWHTDKIFKETNVKRESFDGFAAGLEFVGNSVEVVLAIHDNGKEKVIKDYFDHSVVENFSEVKFKVIHTAKNIKIEIYHDTSLLYDHLRLLDSKYFGSHSEGGYLSLTSSYTEVSEEDAFSVSNINLYRREETDEYDPHKMQVSLHFEDDADKDEIGHAVAELEHFMKYFKVLFGEPKGITIAKTIVTASKDMESLEKGIKKLDTIMKSQKSLNTSDLYAAISKLEGKARGLQKKIIGIQFYTRKMKGGAGSIDSILYLLLAFFSIGIIGLFLREIKLKKDKFYNKKI